MRFSTQRAKENMLFQSESRNYCYCSKIFKSVSEK